eukprot:TRINITY_DN25405_c0_g1_i1.p2 TRINITY_DN25405_c0_g1~~TRINITY_DN25405_c0_g1_i1.p2  ORF type:complete len:227 (+),score=-28.91 TRINITY_DN25405_c0_g1_i1:36-683(+)
MLKYDLISGSRVVNIQTYVVSSLLEVHLRLLRNMDLHNEGIQFFTPHLSLNFFSSINLAIWSWRSSIFFLGFRINYILLTLQLMEYINYFIFYSFYELLEHECNCQGLDMLCRMANICFICYLKFYYTSSYMYICGLKSDCYIQTIQNQGYIILIDGILYTIFLFLISKLILRQMNLIDQSTFMKRTYLQIYIFDIYVQNIHLRYDFDLKDQSKC